MKLFNKKGILQILLSFITKTNRQEMSTVIGGKYPPPNLG